MPRKPSEPKGYVEGRVYPARNARDLSELAEHFQAVADTYAAAATSAIATTGDGVLKPLDDRLSEVGAALVRGHTQSENAHRLLAEWLMHNGGTQRDAADLLHIHRTTAYNYWHEPLAAEDLI